jgi:hypothetical protein
MKEVVSKCKNCRKDLALILDYAGITPSTFGI